MYVHKSPSAIHCEHQEFAVREIDDSQDAEDKRQAHAHQGIDTANQKTGKYELTDSRHSHRLANEQCTMRASRTTRISACSTLAAGP